MSDELFELQDSIRPVLEAAGPAADLETAWTNAVELGWLMTAASEELGGLGLGLASMVLVSSESGRMVSRLPMVSALTAIDVLAHVQNAERVAALMAGSMMSVPLADCAIEHTADTLTGTADALPCLDRADAMLLWTADHSMLCVVPTSLAGVEIIDTPTWDVTRSLSRITLSSVAVPSIDILATGDLAQQLVARLLNLRDILLAADATGVANGLLETTIEHLSVRYQFGRPLAMFQALKHRVADLRTQLNGAEALLATTVGLVESDLSGTDAAQAAMKACYLATEVCASVAEEGLQLHGGIGMAAEHVCHLYLKRAMLNQQLGRQQGDYVAEIADRFIAAC
jgi:alkylation response protein AidB-like acyl-CoA dehydrogenase